MSTEIDVRFEFGRLDSQVLLTPAQVGQVIGSCSTQAVYTALYRGDLPEPLIRRNRQIRWSVGQLRAHLKLMETEFQARQGQAVESGGNRVHVAKKRGRPRLNFGEK